MPADKLEALEAAERDAILWLDGMVVTDSPLYRAAAGADPRELPPWFAELTKNPAPRILCGDDPRLPALPAKPTLVDYFTHRFGPSQHLLQSARLALQNLEAPTGGGSRPVMERPSLVPSRMHSRMVSSIARLLSTGFPSLGMRGRG